ncbi:hypothetical protein, partial [Sideroxydans sp. CL21]
ERCRNLRDLSELRIRHQRNRADSDLCIASHRGFIRIESTRMASGTVRNCLVRHHLGRSAELFHFFHFM